MLVTPGSERVNSNLNRPKLTRVRLLIQTSNLISRSSAVPSTVN